MTDRSRHDAQDAVLNTLLLDLIADGNRLGAPMCRAELQAACGRVGYTEDDAGTMLDDMVEAGEIERRRGGRNGAGYSSYALRQQGGERTSQANARWLRFAIVQHLFRLGPAAKQPLGSIAKALSHRASADEVYRTIMEMEAVGRLMLFDPPCLFARRARVALNIVAPGCSMGELNALLGPPVWQFPQFAIHCAYDHRPPSSWDGTARDRKTDKVTESERICTGEFLAPAPNADLFLTITCTFGADRRVQTSTSNRVGLDQTNWTWLHSKNARRKQSAALRGLPSVTGRQPPPSDREQPFRFPAKI